MSKNVHRLLILAVLFALPLAAGCAVEGETVAVGVSQGSRDAFAAASIAAKVPQDRYLRIIGTKKSKTGQAAIVAPIDLWGPFRCEVKGGLFDVDHTTQANGAIFGMEIDGRGPFPPTEFYGVSSQITGGGLNVYAYTHNSTSSIGSHFFAGATEIELAIDYDGSTFTFLAREPGDLAYQTIATFGLMNQMTPLNPAIGCFNLAKNGVIGFDDFRIVSNGSAPMALAPNVDAARLIGEATTGAVEAMHRLDGADPDYAGASTDLADAQSKLATALAAVLALPASKPRKKAKNDLNDAAERLEAAISLVSAEKKAGKAISHLKVAVDLEFSASMRIYPIE